MWWYRLAGVEMRYRLSVRNENDGTEVTGIKFKELLLSLYMIASANMESVILWTNRIKLPEQFCS
jgi:hypothetical protein